MLIACIVMAYIVMACIVMAYIVMAYIVMAYMYTFSFFSILSLHPRVHIVMAYIVMACIAMAYIVMAYIVASEHRRRHVHCADMGVPVLKMTASERRPF